MIESEKTVQSIFNLFFWNLQNPSLQQFGNLYSSTVAVLRYFNKDGKYDEDLNDILPKLFFDPITELTELYPKINLAKNKLDWNIPQLGWCYHRDTKFRSKLGMEYFVDSRKEQQTKKILLSEIITILSLFKQEMFKRIIKILVDEKIDLIIALPSGSKDIEQIGVD